MQSELYGVTKFDDGSVNATIVAVGSLFVSEGETLVITEISGFQLVAREHTAENPFLRVVATTLEEYGVVERLVQQYNSSLR